MKEQMLQQAQQNEAALKHLCAITNDFYDWRFTKLYYTALHYMKAWIYEKGYKERIATHYDVFNIIERSCKYRVKDWISETFRRMHIESSGYRYEGKVFRKNKFLQQKYYATAYNNLGAIKKS